MSLKKGDDRKRGRGKMLKIIICGVVIHASLAIKLNKEKIRLPTSCFNVQKHPDLTVIAAVVGF